MTKTEYYKSLKHPKWEKKRKKILRRDKHTCQDCLANNKPLHVHHKFYYIEGLASYLYPEYCLVSLCEKCHRKRHEKPIPYVHMPTQTIKRSKLKKSI